MQLTSQVLAQNELNQVVCLSADPKGTDQVEWAAKGDVSGNDLQVIPERVATSPAFLRALTKGVISIPQDSNADEVVAAFDRQRSAFQSRNQSASERVAASIDVASNNDMVTQPCLAPLGHGQTCDEPVATREKTKDDKPALCPKHASLAPQFLPYEDQVGTKVVKVWKMMQMGAPERQTV